MVLPSGLLPLHLALTKKAPPGVVALLLRANPSAGAGAAPSTLSPPLCQCPLPRRPPLLLPLLTFPHPLPSPPSLPAASEKCPDGFLPLRTALLHGAPLEAVRVLLAAHPQAARERYKKGGFPLHLALARVAPPAAAPLRRLFSSSSHCAARSPRVGASLAARGALWRRSAGVERRPALPPPIAPSAGRRGVSGGRARDPGGLPRRPQARTLSAAASPLSLILATHRRLPPTLPPVLPPVS